MKKEEGRTHDLSQDLSDLVGDVDVGLEHYSFLEEMMDEIEVAVLVQGRFPGEGRDNKLGLLPSVVIQF